MLETWELLSYVVTVLGLPFAIFLFIFDRRRERENEEKEIHELLSAAYTDFLKTAIANPDLKLLSARSTPDLDEEQQDRLHAMFDMLISVFERAYLLTYEKNMSNAKLRRWLSWEDFMRQWCRRDDFRIRLPKLLIGEDSDFASHLRQLAAQESGAGGSEIVERDPPKR